MTCCEDNTINQCLASADKKPIKAEWKIKPDGFNLNETKILQFLKKDKRYQQLFSNAFGNNLNAVNLISITKAVIETLPHFMTAF